MRLYITGDAGWTDDAIVSAITADAAPDALILSPTFAGPETDPSCPPDGVGEMRVEEWSPRHAPTVAVLFACGDGAASLSREVVDAGVRLMRLGIPTAVVRERTGNIFARLDHVARTALSHDLAHVRKVLGALYKGVPELQAEVAHVGRAVGLAMRRPDWETVAGAWFEVEKLRDTQPRIALWLCGAHHLLGGWTADLATK